MVQNMDCCEQPECHFKGGWGGGQEVRRKKIVFSRILEGEILGVIAGIL